MGFSVGIGLTNDCNLNCAHCYRDTGYISALTLEQIKKVCQSIPITSMGMGTGENALHSEFIPIVEYLHNIGIRLSIASNGYSLTTMPDGILSAFHDVEVSIDHPTQREQDDWRGEGNWALVHRAIERCQKKGIEVSILATLMCTNYSVMDQMVRLAQRHGVNLRVNTYQVVKSDAFHLSYEQFWEGYRGLLREGLLISCSEPVVRAALGLAEAQSPCGRGSIRINPRGQVIPCVYWPEGDSPMPTIEDLNRMGETVITNFTFRSAKHIPTTAADCPCQGGCSSRRALNRELNAHDEYCPWVRGDEINLTYRPAPDKDLMRAGNVCTTIVC